MKRIFALMLSLLFVFSFSACAGEDEEGPTGSLKGNQTLLRICNWEDYIFEDEETEETLYEQFETWYEEEYGVDITIEYSTFGTNEILYNNLKINS